MKTVPHCFEIELEENMVVLDHIGIPALIQAITFKGKRQYVRGVSCMRIEVGVDEACHCEHNRAVGRHSGQT